MKTLNPGLVRAIALAVVLLTGVRAEARPPRPKLIVAISVDQFSLDLYDAYRASFTGGLKRLGEGRAFIGYQSHGATETCPGHSTILTGDHPTRTGIVANNWYDRRTGSNVYCVSSREDPGDPLAKSSAALKVDTLGDWMRAADPRARVISVSGKDRAAIMMAGTTPPPSTGGTTGGASARRATPARRTLRPWPPPRPSTVNWPTTGAPRSPPSGPRRFRRGAPPCRSPSPTASSPCPAACRLGARRTSRPARTGPRTPRSPPSCAPRRSWTSSPSAWPSG